MKIIDWFKSWIFNEKVFKWCFEGLIVPWIKSLMPAQPDWNDKESVRVFVKAILDTPALVWCVQKTATTLDDEALAILNDAVDNVSLWDAVWSLTQEQNLSFLDRIKGLIGLNFGSDTFAGEANPKLGVFEIAAILGVAIQLIKLIRQRKQANAD